MCRLSFGLVTILVASLAVGLSFAAKKKGEDVAANVETKDERDRVQVTVDGTDYIVPVYNKIYVSPARKEIDQIAINTVTEAFREILDKMFDGAGYGVVIDLTNKLSKDMEEIPEAVQKLKTNGDKSQDLVNGYANEMQKMVKKILTAKSTETLNLEEVKKRAENLFKALELLPEASPTGLYLDWPEMVIGEQRQPLTEHVAPIAKQALKKYTVASLLIKLFPGVFTGFLNKIEKNNKSNASQLSPGDGVKS